MTNYKVSEKNNVKYVQLEASGTLIQSEADGLELVALCGEHELNRILIPAERLSSDFFRLSTGVAGLVLQKLTNYRIKTVVVIDASKIKGKFQDFLVETNSGSMFRTYDNFTDAENWLIDGEK